MGEAAHKTEPETPPKQKGLKPRKYKVKPPKLTERQLAYALLTQNGMAPRDAEKALGYAHKSAYNFTKAIAKYDLTDSKMVSVAHKTIKKLMQGKTFGEIKEVKDSTALAAAKEVYDRESPKISVNQNLNINASISPVDLSAFRLAPSPPGGPSVAEETPVEVNPLHGKAEQMGAVDNSEIQS
jgi:hypothetical protein